MNAFAAVRTGRDIGDCILVSTQEPCSMCAAAGSGCRHGSVRRARPTHGNSLTDLLTVQWPRITAAAADRAARTAARNR
jgi:tRNA(Arg) A34 adenosine deaminase TadA